MNAEHPRHRPRRRRPASFVKAPRVLPPLYPIHYEDLVRRALAEDLGRAGDLTTDAIVPPGFAAEARLVARAAGRIAGVGPALAAFRLLDAGVWPEIELPDGSDAAAGATIATVRGPARALLAAERTALNFLGHLSGVATATREIVAAVAGHRARIVCTRKTTPGLRALEKHAVRAGGGANHRFGLDDGVLIKDNHIAATGSVGDAVKRARERAPAGLRIQVEVTSLGAAREAIAAGADLLLVDNQPPATLAAIVADTAGRVPIEASGGVTLASVAEIARTGVDRISIGALTHSAPAADIALEWSAPSAS
jgi:nicotinate-nucleotide pyrophosphorylase (carboxylating)